VITFLIQITYLEQWPELEEENIGTLAEATEALKASTLRLPVTSGAQVRSEQIVPFVPWGKSCCLIHSFEQADAVAMKNAVSSALDVIQALSSSIFYLQSKVRQECPFIEGLGFYLQLSRSKSM
jgi:hypothetical protein